MFYNKKLFEQAGLSGPPQTLDDSWPMRRRSAPSREVRLLPARQQGRIQRLVHVHGHHERQGRLVQQGRHQHLNEPGAVKGFQFLVDLYQKGYAPKDAVNWGFNEIVAGFYSGTCAMLDQDPDALIAIAEKMEQERFSPWRPCP
jgi:multiple sugar transport system substrate-binding protein